MGMPPRPRGGNRPIRPTRGRHRRWGLGHYDRAPHGLSQDEFDYDAHDWGQREAAKHGTYTPAEYTASAQEYARRGIEGDAATGAPPDPGVATARTELEATLKAVQPGGVSDPKTMGAAAMFAGGGILDPATVTTASQVIAALAGTKDADLHSAGLGGLAGGRGAVLGAEANVRGALMQILEQNQLSGVTNLGPGAPKGVGGVPLMDPTNATLQAAMNPTGYQGLGGPGGPGAGLGAGIGGASSTASIGLLERIVDLLQQTLSVESLINSAIGHLSTGAVAGAGGGPTGGTPGSGAGTSGMAGFLGDVAGKFSKDLAAAIADTGAAGMVSIAGLGAAQLMSWTRSREYEPIRQQELAPGMNQTADIKQVSEGTTPLLHYMGTRAANDLRYAIQDQSIAAGGGLEMGQQISLQLARMGVGFGETKTRPYSLPTASTGMSDYQTAGTAAYDLYQSTRIALGPARAAGLEAPEAAEVVGTMRAAGGLSFDAITHQFENLIDVSQRLGVGTKNLTESYKTMLESGWGASIWDPNAVDPKTGKAGTYKNMIDPVSLGVAQAFLGAGTNVGGMMGGIAQMAPNQQLAMAEAIGMGPKSQRPADQREFIENLSNPEKFLTHFADFTKREGGLGGFEQWKTTMLGITGGQDILQQAGMSLPQQERMWEKMTTGDAAKEIAAIHKEIPKEVAPGTTTGSGRSLERSDEYVADAINQLGQNMSPVEQALQKLTAAINRLMSSGFAGGDVLGSGGQVWDAFTRVWSTITTGLGQGGQGAQLGHQGTRDLVSPPSPIPAGPGGTPPGYALPGGAAALPPGATINAAGEVVYPAASTGVGALAAGAPTTTTSPAATTRAGLAHALDLSKVMVEGAAATSGADTAAHAARTDLDLRLTGTLMVVNQQGVAIGQAQINPQTAHAKVNARSANGRRTSGQTLGGHIT